eukprot:8870-Chlamydomonas_euryale.AAC.1
MCVSGRACVRPRGFLGGGGGRACTWDAVLGGKRGACAQRSRSFGARALVTVAAAAARQSPTHVLCARDAAMMLHACTGMIVACLLGSGGWQARLKNSLACPLRRGWQADLPTLNPKSWLVHKDAEGGRDSVAKFNPIERIDTSSSAAMNVSHL